MVGGAATASCGSWSPAGLHRHPATGCVGKHRTGDGRYDTHGSGGIAAKHALGLLSSPPASPHVTSRLAPALSPRDLAPVDRDGPAVIDAVTVDYLQPSPVAIALVRQ